MENQRKFPVFELWGSAYEIGLAHGRLARKQIEASICCYQEMFQTFSGISWEEAKKYACGMAKNIEEYDPEIMEEIRGIAEGAEKELGDILALNTRSEIVLQGGQVGDGCTSVAFTEDVTGDGADWLGQNWDWKLEQRDALVVLKIHQKDKPDLLLFYRSGNCWEIWSERSGNWSLSECPCFRSEGRRPYCAAPCSIERNFKQRYIVGRDPECGQDEPGLLRQFPHCVGGRTSCRY